MKILRTPAMKIALILGAMLMLATTVWAAGGGQWLTAGQNRDNSRYQKTESKIAANNVAGLAPSWIANTGGDVSATPAVDGDAVYFPDFAGNLFKLDRQSGATIWQKSIGADYTGIPGNFARATPAVYEGMLYFGDQGGRLFAGARMMAVDAVTGDLVWSTQVGNHPAAIVTQSATVFDGVVYVGVASFEELLAAVVPGYECCSFQGSMMALDAFTGQILWQTSMAPEGYSGNAIWGSTPVIDTKRNTLYVATGNNYSVPEDVSQCIIAAGDDEAAQRACLDPSNYFDSVVALDMQSGAVKWSTQVIPFDTWTVSCLFGLPTCPDPAGPDFDFGQAPILYYDKVSKMDLLGIGQKSGQFWTLNPENGEIVFATQVGPGGELGGIMWGSAYDGRRLYTTIANSRNEPWQLVDGSVTNGGGWSALDPSTGEILWQTADPEGAAAMGAVSAANGLLFGCSMDSLGHMYALDGATGEILWSFVSGGSCNAGAAIVNGTVYWGSGYGSLGPQYTTNDKFFAFTPP